jgi:Zn-finger nucleic acid-binding protein
MTFCPFCGVRQEVDLRQINFRDLGTDASLPCPHCTTPLGVIEFDSEPKVRIERCTTCHGNFFNPGELEVLLESRAPSLVWLDEVQLGQIATDLVPEEEFVYRRCPMCAELMSRVNFGGKSGVIIDRCGTHGAWLDGNELRQLIEWWRAGGKLLYQQNEADRVKRIEAARPLNRPVSFGTVESPSSPPLFGDSDEPFKNLGLWAALAAVLIKVLSS